MQDQASVMLDVDRELAKSVCAAIVNFITSNPSVAKSFTMTALTIDMLRLCEWTETSCLPSTADQQELLAAMGYNNFCLEVVTATRCPQ
jgi:hypothetical protein